MDAESQDQIAHFLHRLAETKIWCTSQDWSVNPHKALRTDLFSPSNQARSQQPFYDANNFGESTPQQRQRLVEQCAEVRAALLQERGIPIIPRVKPLGGGRLLAFTPDGTLNDGAANLATHGFFDDDNMPAWDTWIWYVTNDLVSNLASWKGCDSYLLSWVPDQLIGVVKTGIDVNPEECLCWATDLDSTFIRRLKQTGFAPF